MTRPVVLLLLALPSCSHIHGTYKRCDEPSFAGWPAKLSETGLFTERGDLAPGVRSFEPRFELWADGATKRRWIFVPANQRIDTSDPDSWRFPIGTKLWKEFRLEDTWVETRLLERVGPGDLDWRAISYAARANGADADAVVHGVQNALGTPHDIPAAKTCFGCHGGTQSGALGFSAVQLGPALKRFGDVLTKPVEGRLELPGDKIAQRALGYLHANCSHCHNQRRPARKGARCWDPRSSFDLSLYTGQLERVESTSAYRAVVEGADLVSRMEGHGLFRPRMPPLATEVRDDKALELIRLWSRSVPGLRKDH